MTALLGRKLGMTRYFDANGRSIGVTLIEAGPCVITQLKTKKTDGYDAVQIGFHQGKESKTLKPQLGLFKILGIAPLHYLAEFKVGETQVSEGESSAKPGDTLTVELFKEGERISITGTSKGKGFAGVVKRHGFHGGPKTRGQSDRLRAPGSIGASSYPSRVFKGMRMAGRMGGKKNTLRKVMILKVDVDNNILAVKGPVPGATNSILRIWK